MKHILKYFVPMTVAVIALAACNKEQDNNVQEEIPDAPELHINVTAHPDQLQNDVDSKTYIDEKTIKWGTGEYMKIGVFDGTATAWGQSATEAADLYNGSALATFPFDVTPVNNSGSYTYYGLYPFSAAVTTSNTNPASYKVKLPASQNATASSYDPKAYILVAKPESGKTVTDPDWEASFRRATALNKITLRNLEEDIKRVTITVPEEVYIAGSRYVDLTTGLSGEIYSGGGRTNTIEVRFATKQSCAADINVWFTSWDATIGVGETLTIVAYGTTKHYTKAITVIRDVNHTKDITFKEGYLNTLNVDMDGIVGVNNTEVEEGNYVILADNGGTYYALKNEAEGTRMAYESYSESTSSYTGSSSIIWTVAKETIDENEVYTITNSGNYLGWGSGNTASLQAAGVSWTATNYALDIDWKTNHYEVCNHSSTDRILAKNTDSKYGFAFYTGSGYKNLIFVPATIDPRSLAPIAWKNGDDPRTTASVKKVNSTCTWLDPDGSQPTLTITGEMSSTDQNKVTYSSSVTSVATINSSTGAISLAGVGETVIKATYPGAAGDTYRHTEVSYTLTVTPYYTVTFNRTPSNGSFTVKNGETTISTEAEVPAGATINITDITPDSGYALSTLVYNDGSEHDIKSAKTFTMPAHDVTITATFAESGGEPTLVYTFATAKSTSNTAYGNNFDVTISTVPWSVPGNQNFSGYVRIGGKSLDGVDRIIYGGSIAGDVDEIRINTNGVSNTNLTVNSITVTVHSSSSNAQDGSNVYASFSTSDNMTFEKTTEKTVTFTKSGESNCAGKYYRIVFNVTNSTNTNYGLDVTSIQFYKN